MATSPTAQILINKVEAARRQIDAAVRMTFSNEDELAIHTVAQAAYRILRDLLDKQGRSETEELYALGFYHTAGELADGTLPQKELNDLINSKAAFKLLSSLAESIKTGGKAFTADNVKVRLDRKAEWRRLTVTANFLKHADKDTAAHLSLDEIDNDDIIIRATAAYVMVVGQTPETLRQTPEMRAFLVWYMARHDPVCLAKEYGPEMAEFLAQASPAKRRRACLKLVRLFARWRDEAVAVP